jgi:hypothetical protein
VLRERDRATAGLGHLDLMLAATSLRPAVFLQQLDRLLLISVPLIGRATVALGAAETFRQRASCATGAPVVRQYDRK